MMDLAQGRKDFADFLSSNLSLATNATAEEIIGVLLGTKNSRGRYPDAGHSLLVRLDLRRPIHETLEEIEIILKLHRQHTHVKNVFDNWDLCLLVYDAKQVLGSVSRCGDFLRFLFEGHKAYYKRFCDDQNISRDIAKAKCLMNGGYFKYI